VDPSIRYAGQDDLIWDVEIDDEIERGALLSRANQTDSAIPGKQNCRKKYKDLPEMSIEELSLAHGPRKAV